MMQADAWWQVIETYGKTVFPAQIFGYLVVASVAVALFLGKGGSRARFAMKLAMAASFAWIGIVFFLIVGKTLVANYASAFLFLSLAVLFLIEAFANSYEFSVPSAGWRRAATIAGIILVLAYPAFGALLGRAAPRIITPGTFPCPTVSFALILLSTVKAGGKKRILYPMLALLFLWAIPMPILIQIPRFGVYEDVVMLTAGLYALLSGIIGKRDSARAEKGK